MGKRDNPTECNGELGTREAESESLDHGVSKSASREVNESQERRGTSIQQDSCNSIDKYS